jgi:hypothetical protein
MEETTADHGPFFAALQENGFQYLSSLKRSVPYDVRAVELSSGSCLSFALTINTNATLTNEDVAALVGGVSIVLDAPTSHVAVLGVAPSVYAPAATDVGFFVQAGSLTSPDLQPENHARLMQTLISNEAVSGRVKTAIKANGLPGVPDIRIYDTSVIGSIPASAPATGNVSVVTINVVGPSPTYFATTAARVAFAAAMATVINPLAPKLQCYRVTQVTQLAVSVTIRCDNNNLFTSAQSADLFARNVMSKHFPSPGKSGAIVSAMHAAGLTQITGCYAYYTYEDAAESTQTLLFASAAAVAGVSVIGLATVVAIVFVKPSKAPKGGSAGASEDQDVLVWGSARKQKPWRGAARQAWRCMFHRAG